MSLINRLSEMIKERIDKLLELKYTFHPQIPYAFSIEGKGRDEFVYIEGDNRFWERRRLAPEGAEYVYVDGDMENVEPRPRVQPDAQLLYIQGGRATLIYAEMLVGPVSRGVYTNSVGKWLPPHEKETMTEAERKQILQNFLAFFERNGITYQLLD